MNKFFASLLLVFSVHPVALDTHEIYKLYPEICSFRGVSYVGSYVLDLSSKNLTSLKGISNLVVEFDDVWVSIYDVKRLKIVLTGNQLKQLPSELLKLNLVAIDVTDNDDLVISNFIMYCANFYIYWGEGFYNGKKKMFVE